jgi:sec-independent protein translocase protein TatC
MTMTTSAPTAVTADESRMTLVEHLFELRDRLFKAVLALVIAFAIVVTIGYGTIFDIIREPYCNLPADLRAGGSGDCKLVTLGVADPFLLRMRISLIVSMVLAGPVILYQLWAFITPGLHKKEKRFAGPFIVSSTVLFALGALFAYLTLDKGLRFLLGFGDDSIQPLLEAGRYLNYVIFILLAFGVSFQFPLVLVFLELVGVVDDVKLRAWRRNMIFGVAVFTAVITPSQDPFTFLAMAIPMWLSYEVVIFYARVRGRKRRKAAATEGPADWPDDETSPLPTP